MLISLNAVFAGAEVAILSVKKARVRELADGGSGAARSIQHLRQNPERLIATVQIARAMFTLSAGVVGGAILGARLGVLLRDAGLTRFSDGLACIAIVLVTAFVSLVLGELVPKSLALRGAEGYALFVAWPLRLITRLMTPLVWTITGVSNAVLRIFGDRTTFTEARLSPEELQQLVEEAARTGALDPHAGMIASRAFDFGELTVGQIMVPRRDVVALPRSANAEEIKRVLLEEGHSRMPVYEDTLDRIVGYIIAKDVLALDWEKQLLVLQDILRPAYVIPEAARAIDVLKELQRRRIQMAVVVDEQGSVAGLVTIEDLMEELVGKIFGEHDEAVDLVKREAAGSALVMGDSRIRDVNRELDLSLPEGEGITTVGGLATLIAGWIPPVGAKLTADDGTVLEVVDASPRRVRAVRLWPPPKRSDEA